MKIADLIGCYTIEAKVTLNNGRTLEGSAEEIQNRLLKTSHQILRIVFRSGDNVDTLTIQQKWKSPFGSSSESSHVKPLFHATKLNFLPEDAALVIESCIGSSSQRQLERIASVVDGVSLF
jgi:hypothetical protein